MQQYENQTRAGSDIHEEDLLLTVEGMQTKPLAQPDEEYLARLGDKLSQRTEQANLEGEEELGVLAWLFDHPEVLIILVAAGVLTFSFFDVLRTSQS